MNSTSDREPEPIFQAGYAGSIPVARSGYLLFFHLLFGPLEAILGPRRLAGSGEHIPDVSEWRGGRSIWRSLRVADSMG
jgi:hypothetical protein